MTLVFNTIIGLAFGFMSMLALSPGLAAFDAGSIIAWVILGAVLMLCAYAPTIRRGFGRGFLSLGSCLFVLPLSAFLLSSVGFVDVVARSEPESAAFAAIGAGAAAGMFTIFASFVGLILGSVLLVIGLILSLGGQRDVRIVNVPTAPTQPRKKTAPAAHRFEPNMSRSERPTDQNSGM